MPLNGLILIFHVFEELYELIGIVNDENLVEDLFLLDLIEVRNLVVKLPCCAIRINLKRDGLA